MKVFHIRVFFLFAIFFLSCGRDKFCDVRLPEKDLMIYSQLGNYLSKDSSIEGTVRLKQQSEKIQDLIKELTLKPKTIFIDRYYGEVYFQGVKEQKTWYMEHDYLSFIYVVDTNVVPTWDGEDKQFILNFQNKISDHLYLRSVAMQN